MPKVEHLRVFAGISKDNDLLRIELLNVMEAKKVWCYVVYWENMLDFSNEAGSNEIVIEDGVSIFINSVSTKFGYKIFPIHLLFEDMEKAYNFINNNDVFKLLTLTKEAVNG